MPRTRTRRTAAVAVSPAADYGPAYTSRRGRPEPAWTGATDTLELADIADIDRPDRPVTVRVARRRDPLIAILDIRRDGPGREQFLAAERLRRDSAIADGASGWDDGSGVRAILSSPGIGPSGAQIDAQTRCRWAWLAVRGPRNDADVADVVRLIVLGHATLETVDAARRVRHGMARTLLLTGLERLAEHYAAVDVAGAKRA